VLWSPWTFDLRWEDSWACIKGGVHPVCWYWWWCLVCSTQIWLDRLEDIWTGEPVSYRVSVGSCWVLLEVIWNAVLFSCWVVNTFGSYGISLRWSVRKACMLHSVWIVELKLESYNWYWSLESVAWGDDKLNLDQVWLVKINCTYAGDSFWRNRFFLLAKSRSCVNFAEIACRFRQKFVGVRFGFEKSSPRWRIIGIEGIKEIKYIGRVF